MVSLSSSQHLRKRCAGCIIARRNITSAQKRALLRKQPNNTSDATNSSQLPSVNHFGLKDIQKAPHMQSNVFESTAAGKKTGVLDAIKANPLVFAIFVFPTVMMGVALIVRPDFRAQILGTGVGKGDKIRTDVSISVPKNAPAPVYEEADVIPANEEDSKDKREEGVSQQTPSTTSDNQQQNATVPSDIANEVEGGKTKDLIYALGFRSHPSL
jgi:hypothetical protein